MFSNVFFFLNIAISEIMWKNIVEWGRLQMTIWHMHLACWIPKATNMHSEYVILIDFLLQQLLPKCIAVFAVHTPLVCLYLDMIVYLQWYAVFFFV